MPDVTLGMPVYNGVNFIAEAIESLLAQTFADFELIISDNGSTDDTASICRRYVKRDPRIRYFRSDCNRGAAWNYNRTFELSHGTYFKWVGHDDICAPQFLEQCINAFNESGPSTVLCYPRTSFIDASGQVIKHFNGKELSHYNDNLDLRFEGPIRRMNHALKHLRRCNSVFGLIRSNALRKTGLIGDFVASDQTLLYGLALLGRFREIPERLFYRRIHADQYLEANKTYGERLAWFNPQKRPTGFSSKTDFFVENVRSIFHLPIKPHTRVLAVILLFKFYLRDSLKRNKKRITRQLTRLLGVLPFGSAKQSNDASLDE